MSIVSKLGAIGLVFVSLAAGGQTTLYDSDALERVRDGSESDTEYVLRLLDKSMSSVRNAHEFCANYGSDKSSDRVTVQNLKRRNAKVCALIEPLNPSSQLTFESKKSGNLCAPFWKDGKPSWEKSSETKKSMEVYGTEKFVPPSRKEMLKRGYSIMTRDEEQAYFKRIEKIRGKSASACCGTGSESLQCINAMSSVGIEICRDEKSEKDPSHPDRCLIGNGYYYRTPSEHNQLLMQIIRDASRSKRIPESFVASVQEDFEAVLENDQVKAMKVVPGPNVVSGSVVLSRYHSQGVPMQDDSGVMHEFMHACSTIRRQLDVKNDAPTAQASLITTLMEWFEGCNVSVGAVASFGGHLEHLEVNGLASCLGRIAEKSTDPKSQVFTASACPKAKLEEGFAEAMTLLFAEPVVPDGYPTRVCSVFPSATHPHESEVMKCLVAHVPNYKKLLKEAFQCQVSPQQ